MSIDVNAETLVQFTEAAKAFPGRKPCIQTLHRWRLRGVRGNKLDTCLIGGIRYTSREAIQRFIEAQNAGDPPAKASTTRQCTKRSAAARQELEAMGVM